MKSASTGLVSLLNSGYPIWMADLYLIKLKNGAILRFTSWDTSLTATVETEAEFPSVYAVKRNGIKMETGLASSTLDVEVGIGSSTSLIYGKQIQSAAAEGSFDDASIRLDRAFMATPGLANNGYTLCLFEGFIATVEVSSALLKIHARSETEKLNIQYPKNVFSPKCQNVLYDAGCQVNRDSVKASGTLVGDQTAGVLVGDTLSANGYYDLGAITITSGACSGLSRSVLSSTNLGSTEEIILSVSFPVSPAAGDTYEIVPGCQHDLATCTNKFANQNRFRGFPFVPAPETTL